MRKKSLPKRVIVYFGIFAILLIALYVLNQQSDDAGGNTVYGIPASQLSRATASLLDDPNYQKIIVPEQLDQKRKNQESFFVYFFSSTCPHCKQTTPLLNPLIEEVGVHVDQFNLEVFRDGFGAYNIEYTPTLVYYEKGVEKERIVGGIVDANDVRAIDTFTTFLSKYKTKDSSP